MTGIVFYGKKSERKTRLFTGLLSQLGSVVYVSDDKLSGASEQQPDFLVLETNTAAEINFENTIVVFRDEFDAERLQKLHPNATAIVNSQNMRAIELIKKIGVKAVTCGHSSKDTITFSSYTDDTIVISIQRAMQAMHGDEVEPFDLPVRIQSKIDLYSVLSFAGALVLLCPPGHKGLTNIVI